LENLSPDRYEPVKTALNELGFTVDFVEKQAQKTVITVSHCEEGGEKSCICEEQGANGYEARKG